MLAWHHGIDFGTDLRGQGYLVAVSSLLHCICALNVDACSELPLETTGEVGQTVREVQVGERVQGARVSNHPHTAPAVRAHNFRSEDKNNLHKNHEMQSCNSPVQ